MKNLLPLLSLFLLANAATSQTNPNPSPTLDAAIQSEMTNENLPGVATIIVKGGEIVWVESYGYADVTNSVLVEDSTVFLLASMSKLFTGTASMQLLEAGQIDLDLDINRYLPWTADIPGFTGDSITIRQLMTHTSSIEDGTAMDNFYDYPDPSISLADCMEGYFTTTGTYYDAADNFFNNAPGTHYSYSNMGTALNGYITEEVSGIPFDQFCEENIFDVLCMENTGWHFSDFDSAQVARPHQYVSGGYVPYNHYGFADYPDGQLRSNVLDLANFMIAYLNGGQLGSNSILSAGTITDMWTAQVPSLDATQGLNWYQEEIFYNGGGSSNMLWGHNGGEDGVSTDLYLDPVNDIGICVLTNGEGDALYICDELYDYAMNLTPAAGITPTCSPMSVNELTLNDLVLYPNPVESLLTLESSKYCENVRVTISDIQGKVYNQSNFSGTSFSIDVSDFNPGIYILQLQTEDQFRSIRFMVP